MILYTNKSHLPFQIDEEDYDRVLQFKWHIRSGYVHSYKTGNLHVFLMGGAPEGLEWDHKNKDSQDNRKENLRLVTRGMNVFNTRLRSDNSSGHKGVQIYPKGFVVRICKDGKDICIGVFKTLEEAIVASRKAEKKYWE